MITLVETVNMYFMKMVMMHNAVRKSEQFIVIYVEAAVLGWNLGTVIFMTVMSAKKVTPTKRRQGPLQIVVTGNVVIVVFSIQPKLTLIFAFSRQFAQYLKELGY